MFKCLTDPRGFDEIRCPASGLTASQTGVGTTLSPEFVLPIVVEPARYGVRVSTPVFDYTIENNMIGTVTLQGYINGVWRDLLTLSLDYTGLVASAFLTTNSFGAGNLEKFRVQTQVTSGTGTLQGNFNGTYFVFAYGVQNAVATAS